MERITDEKIKSYIKGESGKCLNCGSSNIEGGSMDVDGDTAGQEIRCWKCDLVWYDLYTLTDVVSIEYPEGEEPDNKTKKCPDCAVAVGIAHQEGCDISCCMICGGQRLSCDCKGDSTDIWTGEWPGKMECKEFGWYVKMDYEKPGWVSCEKDDPDAKEDLSRLYGPDAKWDAELKRFVKT